MALALPEHCWPVHTLVPLESETEAPDAPAYIATAAGEIPVLSHLIPPHRESSRMHYSCVLLGPTACNTLSLHNPLLVHARIMSRYISFNVLNDMCGCSVTIFLSLLLSVKVSFSLVDLLGCKRLDKRLVRSDKLRTTETLKLKII